MGLAHTIAMARVLLMDGRAADVERMIAPLLEGATEADEDDRHALHVLMARVEVQHHGRAEAARERLAALPKAEPGSRAAAERLLWLGWTFFEAGENNVSRALRLLDDAAYTFRRLAEPTGLAWACIGQARAFLTIGERVLAHAPFLQAKVLQATLQSVPMREWIRRLEAELPDAPSPQPLPDGLAAFSPAMQEMAEELPALARARLPVLLLGAPGTGKAHLARALHALGPPDASGPFLVLDCASAPPELVTRRLLGDAEEAGALREAQGGTLFLRTVDRLPADAQEGLLAWIESTPLDVRLLASTCCDLAAEGQAGRFREALLDALSPATLRLLPLRARRLDIPLLARHFLDALHPDTSGPRPALTDRARQALLRYDWPGNVRQLRNEIERALLLRESEPAPIVDTATLSPALSTAALTNGAPVPSSPTHTFSFPRHTLDDALARTEKTFIERVLRAQDGQVSASAEVLGLTRQGLYKKMKRLDINASRFQPAAD